MSWESTRINRLSIRFRLSNRKKVVTKILAHTEQPSRLDTEYIKGTVAQPNAAAVIRSGKNLHSGPYL